MLNRMIFMLLVMLAPTLAGSQTLSGTYSIVAFCEDGFVLGIDSRTSLYDPKDKALLTPLGYYDTTQKVFQFDKFGIVYMGSNVIGNKFTSQYISEYKSSQYYKTITSPTSIIGNLFAYVRNQDTVAVRDFTKLKIFVAGYLHDTAFMCSYYKYEVECSNRLRDSSYFATDSFSGFGSLYSPKYTCDEMAIIIESTITKYAKQSHKEAMIGGKIMLLKIYKTRPPILMNYYRKSKDYKNKDEIYNDYRNHKFKIYFTSDSNEIKYNLLAKQNNSPNN
jgi:hypothetical protein